MRGDGGALELEARGRKEREGCPLDFEGFLKEEEMMGKEREGTVVLWWPFISLSLAR